jgi:hypothetical protein
MSPQNLFRCLIVISLGCALAAVGVTQLPGDIPQDWKTAFEWNGNGSLVDALWANPWFLFGLGIPFALLGIASLIGMFVFWRFARPVYAALTGLSVLLTLFGGLVVQLPAEAALMELSLLADGAVVALSYSPPFSSYFESRR